MAKNTNEHQQLSSWKLWTIILAHMLHVYKFCSTPICFSKHSFHNWSVKIQSESLWCNSYRKYSTTVFKNWILVELYKLSTFLLPVTLFFQSRNLHYASLNVSSISSLSEFIREKHYHQNQKYLCHFHCHNHTFLILDCFKTYNTVYISRPCDVLSSTILKSTNQLVQWS